MPKTWSKPFLTILKSKTGEWSSAKDKSERMRVVKEVADAISDQLTADGEEEDLPDGLDDKIWNWFGNNVAKINQPGESAPKKRGKKVFSARDVVKSTHKERILDLVSMKTDRPMGHKDWLKHYPSALTKVMQALTQDELAEAETLADQWNNARLPREVQRTNAEKCLADNVKSFLKDIEHKTGAQLFVMAAFEKVDGTVALTKFQTPHHVGDLFTSSFPKWKESTWESWELYARDQYNQDYDGSEDFEPQPKNVAPSKAAAMIKSHEKFGWPLFPKRGDMPLDDAKDVLREYVRATYSHFTHNKDVSPPWGALSRDKNYAYLHIDCLPSGMLLLDPSKILAEDLRLIWIHWMARQRADSQALVFLKAKPGVMREAMPQPQQSRPRKETVGTDFFDDPDNEEGPSQGPHPDSPAAHASSPASKLLFLQSLSSDKVYNTFVDLLNSKEEQENATPAKNLPTWGDWQWKEKFLPEEFHLKPALLQMFKLAREDFSAMGSDAQLVVLSIGLALRDISAIHFNEGDEYPEDVPEWAQQSSYNIEIANKLLNVWGNQLAVEDSSGDETAVPIDSKGKGKAKVTGKSSKRKAKSHDEGLNTDEMHPASKKEKRAKRGAAKPLKDDTADSERKLRSHGAK